MSNKETQLYGTLHSGIVGPGAETTGYILSLGTVEVDVGGLTNVRVTSADRCTVAGEWETRHWPLRGNVRVLRAKQIAADPSHLSHAGKHASVILSGALQTGIMGIGGETTGVHLVGAAPDADVSAVKSQLIINKPVAAIGHFTARHYALRGLQYVYVIDKLSPSADTSHDDATESGGATGGETGQGGKLSAIGYSDSMSFDEALRDAISKLDRRDLPPDFLFDIHVDSIDAQVGGIAGFHRIAVTVSANKPHR